MQRYIRNNNNRHERMNIAIEAYVTGSKATLGCRRSVKTKGCLSVLGSGRRGTA